MTDWAIKYEGTKGTYTLTIKSTRKDGCQPLTPRCWELSRSGEVVSKPPEPKIAVNSNRKNPAEILPIPRINLGSKNSFEAILQKGLPVVMEGMDLGPCGKRWTLKYLTEHIGVDRKVR